MNALTVLNFFGISLIPFVGALFIHLLFKFTTPLKTHRPVLCPPDYNHRFFYYYVRYPIRRFFYCISSTEKGSYWWRQIWVGLFFTGLAIGGFYLGVKVHLPNNPLLAPDNYILVVGNSTVSSLIASLVFGWPAGVISGVLTAIFRILAGGFLCWPTVIAILISGCGAGVLSHFIFKGKRPRWYFCILFGIFVEIFNMLLVFFFNMKQINAAYEILSNIDLCCIGFSALTTALTSLVISLIEHERIFPKKEERNNVTTKVQGYLFLICTLGLVILCVSIRGITDSKSVEDFTKVVNDTTDDISRSTKVFIDNIDLIREHYENIEIPKGSGIFQNHPIAYAEAHRFKRKVEAFSEVPNNNHITSNGFCVIVPNEEFIKEFNPNYPQERPDPWNDSQNPLKLDNFNITSGTQEITDTARQICEDWNAECKKLLQVNNILSATKNCPLAVNNKLIINGKNFPDSSFNDYHSNAHFCYVNGVRYLMSYEFSKSDDNPTSKLAYILVFIPASEITKSSGITFRVAFYIDIMVFILIFSIAAYFIRYKILRRIELMDEGLERIMGGDIETELHVEGYNEFNNLNNNINLAVGALRNYATEIQHRIEAELKLARDIQTGSVPTAFPVEKNYNIYAKMEPAKEVGGDFYDYVKMNNGRIMFLIADVSGKGVPAALFMMRAKTLIKSLASTDIPLSDIVNITNKDLCTQNETGTFVTAWIGILDPNNGELRYVNAGHTNPVIKHKDGQFEEFKENHHGLVLAALPDINYQTEIMYLQPGDEIVLYTDGITEAQNHAQELFGVNRLLACVNKINYFNAKQLLDGISDEVVKFADGAEQFDDMTLLIMRYLGNTDNIVPETSITLKARPTNATIAVNFVESILAKFELPPAFIAKVSIVVDELFANIAFYAYPKNYVGEATIEVDLRDDCLYLNIIDSGKPFDPTAPRETQLSGDINERKRGGLGIYIVKKTMDEMKYVYEDGHNKLNLMKRIKPKEEKEIKDDGKGQ